jgi:hypothetical protein
MSNTSVELLPVGDATARAAARSLITEYLEWIARQAADNYGLAFDIAAMVASDLDDSSKFYPPEGRFFWWSVCWRKRAHWSARG